MAIGGQYKAHGGKLEEGVGQSGTFLLHNRDIGHTILI